MGTTDGKITLSVPAGALTLRYRFWYESFLKPRHLDDVKLVVPHQVNTRILDFAAEKLNLPKEKMYVNIERVANTSAASIPIALDEAARGGYFQRGDVIVLVAFGGGLTWASMVLRW